MGILDKYVLEVRDVDDARRLVELANSEQIISVNVETRESFWATHYGLHIHACMPWWRRLMAAIKFAWRMATCKWCQKVTICCYDRDYVAFIYPPWTVQMLSKRITMSAYDAYANTCGVEIEFRYSLCTSTIYIFVDERRDHGH